VNFMLDRFKIIWYYVVMPTKRRGRPEGYKPYYNITLKELKEYFADKAIIQVSRKQMEQVMGKIDDDQPKAETELINDSKPIKTNLIKETKEINEENKISFTLTNL
jgi:hypothetical protein